MVVTLLRLLYLMGSNHLAFHRTRYSELVHRRGQTSYLHEMSLAQSQNYIIKIQPVTRGLHIGTAGEAAIDTLQPVTRGQHSSGSYGSAQGYLQPVTRGLHVS